MHFNFSELHEYNVENCDGNFYFCPLRNLCVKDGAEDPSQWKVFVFFLLLDLVWYENWTKCARGCRRTDTKKYRFKDSPVIVNPPTNKPMSLPPTMILSLRSMPSPTPEFLFFHAAQIPTNRIRT